MSWYWWVAIVAAGYGSYAILKVFKKMASDQKALEAAITAYVGRPPDHILHMESHSFEAGQVVAAFIAERKIYIGGYAEQFDADRLLKPEDVRSWSIKWDTGIDDRGRTFKRRFCLHVAVRSIEAPLVRIDCRNEAMAYRMREIFDQALGDRDVAALT